MKRLIGVLLLLVCFLTTITAQPITESQAREELDKLGLEEDEVKERLLARGIDIDNINPDNPAEVLAIESALQEVIAELQAEKAAAGDANTGGSTPPSSAPSTTTEFPADTIPPTPPVVKIQKDKTQETIDAIKEADQEAEVIEELVDAQNILPPSEIFGQHIFRNKGIKLYRQSEDIKPPASYVLGVGDIIAVSIWGQSQEGGVYEINKAGYIKPTSLPRIYLKGISFGKAKELLMQRFSQYYSFRPEEFELTINYSRTITINISGEAANYGSFTIPAINTAFNALVAAGGPTDIGSVRNIRLIRSGEQARTVDVYKFLLNPSVSANFYLQENDFIHIPVAERLVGISGAINRSFRYELTQGENLNALIDFAGGFRNDAYLGNLQIKRIINDEQIIIDVDYNELKKQGTDFQLLPGDNVTVKTLSRPYERYTQIEGAVELPGKYAYTEGMRISDLIQKGQLREGARKDIAFMQRYNVDGTARYVRINIEEILNNLTSPANVVLQPKDKIIVYSELQFTQQATFSISGAVRDPVKLPYDSGKEIRVGDALILAGGTLPQVAQYGYIKRTNPLNRKEKSYIRVDIQEVLRNPNSAQNIVFEPFDQLTVYSEESFFDGTTVSISGAVREAGEYEYDNGLRVSDLLYFSKGLNPEATSFAYLARRDPSTNLQTDYIRLDLNAIAIDPQSAANITLEPFDAITVFSKTTYTDETSIKVDGAVRNPSEFPYAEVFTLKDALTLAGGLKLEASKSRIDVFRIEIIDNKATQTIAATMEVDENLNPRSGGAFQLEPFDLIVVRKVPEFEFQKTVSIEGEVKYPGPYSLIADNERLLDVIQRAGGLTLEAFPEGATLYRPDGGVGYIIVDLEKVLTNKKDRTNFILRKGDVIQIPKQKDLVTIKGATRAIELYPDKVLEGGKINVAYRKGKSAKWYVDKYAAGVGENGKRKLITVEHANGEIERTKNFLFFRNYPSVREGSVVTVGTKPPKPKKEKEEGEKEKVNWGKTIADSLAQATAVLSLILLVQQVSK